MSFTSALGRWSEYEGAALFAADKPVSVARVAILANNLHHLRDTSPMERISHLTMVGESIAATDSTGHASEPTPLLQYTTPWTMLRPTVPARPVLRVGAHRNAAGTSYISAGLFPVGNRHYASGFGAMAWWPEVSFTATTPTIVLEDAVAPVYSTRPTLWSGATSHIGFMEFAGKDPQNDGSLVSSSSSVMMLTLALFVRHTGTSETRVSLVQLREFSGP